MDGPSAELAYLFTHAVYREVAYHLQLPSERARLHGLALDILEAAHGANLPAVALALAQHARLASENPTREDKLREARFLRMVMEAARQRAAQETGLRCADRLLELDVLDSLDQFSVMQQRANMLADLGRAEATRAAQAQTIEFATRRCTPRERASALLAASRFEAMQGGLEACRAMLAQADAIVGPDGDAGLRGSVLESKATLADHEGDQAAAESMFRQAIELQRQAGNRPLMRQVQGNLANTLAARGRREEALAILLDLIPHFEADGDLRTVGIALSNVAKQLLVLGRHAQSEQQFLRAIELHRMTGVRRSEAFALANLSEVWRHLGKLDQSEQAIVKALAIAREVGQPVYSAAYLATHAGLLLLTGRETEAQQRLEESRAEFEAGGGGRYVPEYCDIWRLRVAASQACNGGAPKRGTSRLRAEPPDPRWVKAAGLILESMKSVAGSGTADLNTAIAAAEKVVDELRHAAAEKRPALLLRGHLPAELAPALRHALLERMTARHPEQLAMLRKQNPALVAALES